MNKAVAAARKAFDEGPWRQMDARERGEIMYRLADLIEAEMEELAALETLDNGKPISDSLAADLPLTIDCLRYYAGYADKIHGQTIPVRGNYFTYTKKEPVGVVGQIILELPNANGGMEMGSRVGSRLHDCHETCRTNAAYLPPDGSPGSKSRDSRWSHQRSSDLVQQPEPQS